MVRSKNPSRFDELVDVQAPQTTDRARGVDRRSPPGRAPRPGPAPRAGRNSSRTTRLPLRCRGQLQVPGGLVLSIPADGRVKMTQRGSLIEIGRATRLWVAA
eukprot:scaffold10181_cov120-Isochrysis_galbana.AAC.6